MKIDVKKTDRAIKWVTEHTLTAEQRKKLIEEKLKRAEQAHHALKHREGLIKTV
jgi:hypothetical protein